MPGTTIHWINGNGGNWTTAADWSTGTVPGAADTAVIDAAGNYEVLINSAVTVTEIDINDTGALLAVPSLWEALPLLPMEAMVAGVPVLGTDCIGLREVLRDTPSRVVRAGEVGALLGGFRASLEKPRATINGTS